MALARCWMTRGYVQAAQLANTFNATTTPTPSRPRYRPAGEVSSVPNVMWFIFLVNPVTATMAT